MWLVVVVAVYGGSNKTSMVSMAMPGTVLCPAFILRGRNIRSQTAPKNLLYVEDRLG